MLSAAQARASIDDSGEDGYVLAYQPIGVHVDRMLFPCYADGRVDLDRLEPLQLNDYLFARALVGHAYSEPSIVRVDLAPAL